MFISVFDLSLQHHYYYIHHRMQLLFLTRDESKSQNSGHLRLHQDPLRLEGVALSPAARRAGVDEGGAELQQRRRRLLRRLVLLPRGRPQEAEERGEDPQLALHGAAAVRAAVGHGAARGGAVPGGGGGGGRLGQEERRLPRVAGVPGGGSAKVIEWEGEPLSKVATSYSAYIRYIQ